MKHTHLKNAIVIIVGLAAFALVYSFDWRLAIAWVLGIVAKNGVRNLRLTHKWD